MEPHKLWKFAPGIFALCCLMVYSGAVNNGVFGVFPAVPFLVCGVYIAYHGRKTYIWAGMVTLLLSGYLHHIKVQKHPIFSPAIGKQFRILKPFCLTTSGFLFEQSREICPTSALARNSVFTIFDVRISHADMSEHYHPIATTELGPLEIFDLRDISWVDGTAVKESDLTNPIFYYPSLLMYWPVSPLLIQVLL